MNLDAFIQITSNPNTFTVSYIVFDDDGLTVDSKRTIYIAHDIKEIAHYLLNEIKPTFYKFYCDDVLISQVRP
jgi:hypothetical protein